mmetsp:Transcript_9530/g.18324  ORF Transcript_9530/g.18324 Transcript_9530/m.18324 type:complete len:453 (+) Transcript_9530:234-1592(+)
MSCHCGSSTMKDDEDDNDLMIFDMMEEEFNEMGFPDTQQRLPVVDSPSTIIWQRQPVKPGSHVASSSSWRTTHHSLRNSFTTPKQKSRKKTADSPISRLLPDDLLAYMATFLNVGSLKQARTVNRKFHRILSQDKAGWKDHLQRLWSRRLHVRHHHHHPLEATPAIEAYRASCQDARLRHAVHLTELLFDPQNSNIGTIWSFRFKQVAGNEWTSGDPWHRGLDARQLVFLANGSVRQLVWHNHDDDTPPTYTLHTAFYDAPSLMNGGLEIRWRFVHQPIDMPKKESGAYVRLTIAGRDVPTYIVHRSPVGDWSWIMENCWGVFASSPLPHRVLPPSQPPVVVPRMRLRRDRQGGARWLDVSGVESDDEDDGLPPQNKQGLLQDSNLQVTCRWQWREALLYNLGASVLPDGPNATADFDRAWQLSMRSMQSFGFPTHHHHPGGAAAAQYNNAP